jgi:hypothetical protein
LKYEVRDQRSVAPSEAHERGKVQTKKPLAGSQQEPLLQR